MPAMTAFDRKAWRSDKSAPNISSDKHEQVDIARRKILGMGAVVATAGITGAGAGYLASNQERKSNTPTLQEMHRRWHEKTLKELEKGNGALTESIKQQISRHLVAQDWCHSQIRTLEHQLSHVEDEATIEFNQENIYGYQSQAGFFTSEIRRLSQPIFEYHKKHSLPMPEGIPLPDEMAPGQQLTSL